MIKRSVQVFRMGKGYRVIDKGIKIYETQDQSSESRSRVRNFLIKNNLNADPVSVNRYSWLRVLDV